ncbi:hypothetical protein PM082_014209 [Marasmius tenuissimus]|nr:hypothetical protein PM082_014209 [Marasmius tenuissimus]
MTSSSRVLELSHLLTKLVSFTSDTFPFMVDLFATKIDHMASLRGHRRGFSLSGRSQGRAQVQYHRRIGSDNITSSSPTPPFPPSPLLARTAYIYFTQSERRGGIISNQRMALPSSGLLVLLLFRFRCICR